MVAAAPVALAGGMANHPETTATADSALPAVLDEFFRTKSSYDVDGTMSFFSPGLAAYIDATLGWDFDSYAALKAVFEQYMPTWAAPARSYATRILAGPDSALIHMTDTPELFGGELRILAAVDFADGKIVRWVDYWDSAGYDPGLYQQFRTAKDAFPADLKDGKVPTRAAPELVAAATTLQQALAAGDSGAAAATMHPDVVLTDMALRTQIVGRIETERYLGRVVSRVPYGQASTLRHVVGGRDGGGFEWTAGPGPDGLSGITALDIDNEGIISGITVTYDSRQLPPVVKQALVLDASPA
jgi:hypothetical protein